MSRVREIPYNYTSFSDREIVPACSMKSSVKCGRSSATPTWRTSCWAARSAAVRFSKEESLRKGIAALAPDGSPVKVLTSCPSCLQGLARFSDDTGAEADYIVVELARRLLGENWLPEFVSKANAGGIERVLL